SEIQGTKITSNEQFRRVLEGFKSGQYVRMYVTTPNRGGAPAGRPLASYRVVQVP
ncbi:MAG: hypothetical protein JWN02_1659, partial [Acidobacteria bacterium]|nr:hypothetical protein [Acidobacteriota bacterium]